MNQQELNFINQKIICTDCEKIHFFENERFIRCECGNVIINPKFQTKEKNLKNDKRPLKESIKIIFTHIFVAPFAYAISYVIVFWFIGFLFGITGWKGESIRGWFFADNVDPFRSSFLELICHPIFFILLFIGFTSLSFAKLVKKEKIKDFFTQLVQFLFVFYFLVDV